MAKSFRQASSRNSLARTAVLSILYFLFLYAFQLPGLPFGSVIPVLGLLAIYTGYEFIRGNIGKEKTRVSKMVRTYWFWNVFILVYVSCILQIYGSGDGITPLNGYKQMLVILPLIFISGRLVFRNLEELMKALYLGVIIQSLIILLALFIPAVQLFLFMLIPEGSYNTDFFGGVDVMNQSGYHIGLGVFTSAGSLKMAIGQIGACYYLIKSRGLKLFYHLVLYLLIAISTSMVARTGLIISLVGLLCVFWVKRRQSGVRALKFVLLIFIVPLISYYVITVFLPSSFLGDTFQRIIDTAEDGIDSWIIGYSGESGHNSIPPISPETIVGMGITYGVSGTGITTITDGGFLRNYSAMGLIVAIINYLIIGSFFIMQFKAVKTYEYKGVILFMLFILLIGEFKEYYIYFVSPMCFFFLIFCMMEREEALAHIYNPNKAQLSH